MESILDKAKRGLSEGFEKFLKKNYDGQVKDEQDPVEESHINETPPINPISPERPIVDVIPVFKKRPLPPITWYILRIKYLKGGKKKSTVTITNGKNKEVYDAAEWLKQVRFEPSLSCFVAAVVNAVKPETQMEAMVADYSS